MKHQGIGIIGTYAVKVVAVAAHAPSGIAFRRHAGLGFARDAGLRQWIVCVSHSDTFEFGMTYGKWGNCHCRPLQRTSQQAQMNDRQCDVTIAPIGNGFPPLEHDSFLGHCSGHRWFWVRTGIWAGAIRIAIDGHGNGCHVYRALPLVSLCSNAGGSRGMQVLVVITQSSWSGVCQGKRKRVEYNGL